MKKVAVVGATGYAGAELVRILAIHPHVELALLTSRQYENVPYARVYPAMQQIVDLICQPFSIDRVCAEADVIFTALPHKLPMAFVPQMLKSGKQVIDLSADFRISDATVYEAHYEPHTAPELLEQAVYGLAEVYADQIETADLVGNPGCYPTSALLPLVPLLREGLLCPGTIVIDPKSGVSGAGRSPSLTTHFCEANESYKAYKVAQHRHTPEIEQELSLAAGQAVAITFVPHLVPMTRGMLTTTYVELQPGVDEARIRECLQATYTKRPFVRICPEDRVPDTLHVKATNYCDIGFKIDARVNRLILISAIDNLVKGAAGQAVQNMNIMLGLEETAGMQYVPFAI